MSAPVDLTPILAPLIEATVKTALDLAAAAIKSAGLTSEAEATALASLRVDVGAAVKAVHETTATLVRDV